MKVKVEDLKPNPYRNMEKYPIDREKTESLKISINETTFWDNILARKVDGEIQIAYGHHRLLALQELGIKEIDIPIKPIDNSNMIRIMANENMDQWGMNPSTTLETVRATRDYLDGELGKYDSWESANKSISSLFTEVKGFRSAKGQGVGQTTISMGSWGSVIVGSCLINLLNNFLSLKLYLEILKIKGRPDHYPKVSGRELEAVDDTGSLECTRGN